MAWLQDNGDENEFSQFEEEEEGGEKDEGLLEDTEEEVTIVERPGVPVAPAPSASRPKPRRSGATKAKKTRKPAAKARTKKRAAAKTSKKAARKSSKSRKKR